MNHHVSHPYNEERPYMPKKMEKSLRGRAAAKGLKGAAYRRYVFGTLRKKAGWTPTGKKRKKRG